MDITENLVSGEIHERCMHASGIMYPTHNGLIQIQLNRVFVYLTIFKLNGPSIPFHFKSICREKKV